MKKISALVIFFACFFFNGISQNENSKDGFYQTYEDYLKGNLKYEDIDAIGTSKVFLENGTKHKIKGSPYYGCRMGDREYRFYKGKSYKILLDGKIKLYSNSRISVTKDENGMITKVNMNIGNNPGKLYLQKGDGLLKKMGSQSSVADLFSDDPVVLNEYNKGKAMLYDKIVMNVISSVQLYNSRNKN